MEQKKCPICGNDNAVITPTDKRFMHIDCPNCGKFNVSENIMHNSTLKTQFLDYRIPHVIYSFLIAHDPIIKDDMPCYYWFYFDKENDVSDPCFINVNQLLETYPKGIIERIDAILLNFFHSKMNNLGQVIHYRLVFPTFMYCGRNENNNRAIIDTFRLMVEMGYLTQDKNDEYIYFLSVKGRQRIEDLNKAKITKRQGFIAMQFSDETDTIFKAIYSAIDDRGYFPQRIDKKEYNGQIVPEILYEIKISRFVVVDLTYPNYGAYYEAGYATACGKEVICLCKKEVFEKQGVHFDISQKNLILWNDEKDLMDRLKKRIIATIVD